MKLIFLLLVATRACHLQLIPSLEQLEDSELFSSYFNDVAEVFEREIEVMFEQERARPFKSIIDGISEKWEEFSERWRSLRKVPVNPIIEV